MKSIAREASLLHLQTREHAGAAIASCGGRIVS
jgi:hypothetical protein